jgi:hypothetical protein
MPTESVDIIFKADPSEAVNAAKKVTEETNKIKKSSEENNKTLKEQVEHFRNLKGKIVGAAVAAFALKKIYDSFAAFRDHVDEAEKLSRAIETSYENAQELAIAEKEAGLAAGSIRTAIEGIAMAQSAGIVSPDLLNLGFTFKEIKDQKPDELFDTLSKKLSKGSLTALQFEAAVNVLGDSGSAVALKLASNFESFREAARESGKIIEEETFGTLINESDLFLGQIQQMGEDIIKASTPFQDFGELAVGALNKVNETIGNLIAMVRIAVNTLGGLMGGMDLIEASDFAMLEVAAGAERAAQRAKRINESRAATENLTEERAAGAVDFLDFLRGRSIAGSSEISSLQKVGLAATGGEAEGIRLQRRQLVKADDIVKKLAEQTDIIIKKF